MSNQDEILQQLLGEFYDPNQSPSRSRRNYGPISQAGGWSSFARPADEPPAPAPRARSPRAKSKSKPRTRASPARMSARYREGVDEKGQVCLLGGSGCKPRYTQPVAGTKEFVINPESGYPIAVGGPTYRRVFGAAPPRSGEVFYKEPAHALSEDVTYTNRQLEDMARRMQFYVAPGEGTGRGGYVKGWGDIAPKTKKEREALYRQCPECFLLPKDMKFPICAKCGSSPCVCKIQCRGLAAAETRAVQFGYKGIADAAHKLRLLGCPIPASWKGTRAELKAKAGL